MSALTKDSTISECFRNGFALLALAVLAGCSGKPEPDAADAPQVDATAQTPPAVRPSVPKPELLPAVALSQSEREGVMGVYRTLPRLRPIALDLSNPAHRTFFTAHRKTAGVAVESDPELMGFLKVADAYYAKHGKPKSGFVFVDKGKLVDENGAETDGPVGPVLTVTSFQSITNQPMRYGVSALVSLPQQPQSCTQTLQVFDESGNPQGAADINTQALACENAQLYAEGQLDASDRYASAHLMAHGLTQSGTPFVYAVVAEGSSIPTQIVSTDPNDKNGDNMIKFCFGRISTDCDYSPSGGSQSNVSLPINGNTTWGSAVTNPASDAQASVSITITQPQPQSGGGCNLVGNVQQFLQQYVTLINNNQTVKWSGATVQFPAINSTCMPNGSIVYYNMSMNVDLAGTTPTPTFFGISSSPDTPISTGFYLMLPQTRIYYSCLAAETPVLLADGRTLPIADVREGDLVAGETGRGPLKISAIYTGTENTPLVDVRTVNGMSLKVTQGHPVLTERGVRLARFLRQGDVLITSGGRSPIAAIKRVPYEGRVYNLSLASPDPRVKVADDQQVFFGGGILVGDNEMQWRYDRANATEQATALAKPVPHMSESAKALLARRMATTRAAR